MPVDIYGDVILTRDVTERELRAGDVGTVVERHVVPGVPEEGWRTITARMALTHSTGFHNFWFIEPDQKLRIHIDPGSRYSFSGEGFSLLQFAIEQGARTKGLGLDVKKLTDAIFVRLGMTRTSLQWRPDFRPNLADGWNDKGEPLEHDERSNRQRCSG